MSELEGEWIWLIGIFLDTIRSGRSDFRSGTLGENESSRGCRLLYGFQESGSEQGKQKHDSDILLPFGSRGPIGTGYGRGQIAPKIDLFRFSFF